MVARWVRCTLPRESRRRLVSRPAGRERRSVLERFLGRTRESIGADIDHDALDVTDATSVAASAASASISINPSPLEVGPVSESGPPDLVRAVRPALR